MMLYDRVRRHAATHIYSPQDAECYATLCAAQVFDIAAVVPLFHDWSRDKDLPMAKRPPYPILWGEWDYEEANEPRTQVWQFRLGCLLQRMPASELAAMRAVAIPPDKSDWQGVWSSGGVREDFWECEEFYYEDNLRKAAQLAGARFVYSSEIDEEHRLNEQLIKDMTGGDTMEARRLYKEAFNFKPTFKPWLYGNHKPEIRGTDDALWDRVKLIEFPVSFADRVDLALPHRLRQELSGILTWALAGCRAWQQAGLNPPERVKTATATYRKEQDLIGQFITECCQTGDDYMQCKAAALYAAYRRWAETNEVAILSQKRFGTYLTVHGYPSDDNATGRGVFRKKIALRFPPENDDDEDENANLRTGRLTATKASIGATKPELGGHGTNLPNPTSRTSLYIYSSTRLSGNKLSKVSNASSHESYRVEKEGDTTSNLPQTKVSTLAEACPQCRCSHLLALGVYRKCPLCAWTGKLPAAGEAEGGIV
jgi:hypothetical protein